MPRREPSAFVWDVLDASRSLTSMFAGMTEQQYLEDKVRRLAAERWLIIVAHSLSRSIRA